MHGTPRPIGISTKQARIASMARTIRDPLHTLAKNMDLDWMREAYRQTRKDGATGIDGVTAEAYSADLDANLGGLLDRILSKEGKYRAPPVRRAEIPKGDGGDTRPIGIPTFEDKVAQRAIKMLLEPVYEQEFYDFSYGFRPGRSAHQALHALFQALWNMRGGWVLDVDVSKFFDTLDHQQLRDLLRQRVDDGVVVRMVGKWLNAGVMDGGIVTRIERGTPQGGVISPLLANIYLHEVLDTWWVEVVLPRLRGRATLIRYADDFVIVFSDHADALAVQEVLPKRLARFGLTVHPDKTRLVPFRPPDDPQAPPPGSFDFLGFTHFWGRSRKGTFIPKRKTAHKRLTRALKAARVLLAKIRHLPLEEQHGRVTRVLRGHYEYYGIRGNSVSIQRFTYWVRRAWFKCLNRRSQRRSFNWAAYARMLVRFPLPNPRIRHWFGQQPLTANP
jgi:group II intron reverse transcriptase/maturase